MRHLPFDDERLNDKLAKAYPALSATERAEVLVDLMVFVRALAGMVERDITRAHGEAANETEETHRAPNSP